MYGVDIPWHKVKDLKEQLRFHGFDVHVFHFFYWSKVIWA